MDRRVTLPKRATSPTWGLPHPCKQAVRVDWKLKVLKNKKYIERGYYTVARRYEFYFRVAKQYFTNERSEWVKYCFCHSKIKFISSSRRVMFFLLYRQKDVDKIIEGNDRNYVIDKLTCEIMENKPLRSRMQFLWILRVVYFPVKHSCLYNKYIYIYKGEPFYWPVKTWSCRPCSSLSNHQIPRPLSLSMPCAYCRMPQRGLVYHPCRLHKVVAWKTFKCFWTR